MGRLRGTHGITALRTLCSECRFHLVVWGGGVVRAELGAAALTESHLLLLFTQSVSFLFVILLLL
jgi:hypothetical protein